MSRIIELREKLGLSQRRMAWYLGISPAELYLIENRLAPIRYPTILRIINQLKVNGDWFLSGVEDAPVFVGKQPSKLIIKKQYGFKIYLK